VDPDPEAGNGLARKGPCELGERGARVVAQVERAERPCPRQGEREAGLRVVEGGDPHHPEGGALDHRSLDGDGVPDDLVTRNDGSTQGRVPARLDQPRRRNEWSVAAEIRHLGPSQRGPSERTAPAVSRRPVEVQRPTSTSGVSNRSNLASSSAIRSRSYSMLSAGAQKKWWPGKVEHR
jgi:hypothetical protein